MGLDIYFHKRLNRQNAPKAEEIETLRRDLYKADMMDITKADENEALLTKALTILDENGETVKPEIRESIAGFRSALKTYGDTPGIAEKDYGLMTEAELNICRAVLRSETDARDLLYDLWVRITEDKEVAYFRKVNLLVEYFEYVDDCSDMVVTEEQLQELVEKCEYLIEFAKEHPAGSDEFKEKASVTLPTQSGFFFGNTDYDEWYLRDLKEIVERLSPVIADTDFDRYDIIFHCWW